MKEITKSIIFGQLVIYIGSLLITPVTLEKGLVLAILAGLLAFFEFKTEKKELVQLKSDMEEIKKQLDDQKKFSQELNSHVSPIKMGQNIKTVGRF